MFKVILITPLTGAESLVDKAKTILAAADEGLVTEACKQEGRAEALAAEINTLRQKHAVLIAEMESKQAAETGELKGDIATAEEKVSTLSVIGTKVKKAMGDLNHGLSE